MTRAISRSKRQRAEPDPQRPVDAGERDHRVDQPDRREAVEHAGDDVDDEQHDHQQRDVAVQRVDREPRPARRDREAHRAEHAEHDAGGQQHQGHRTGAAGEVPVGARAGGGERALMRRVRSSVARGQPARWRTVPSARDQPARQTQRGQPARPRASPRTIAAVLAMLASRHEPAATLTVRQHDRRRPAGGRVDQVMGIVRSRSASAARSCSRWPGRRCCSVIHCPGASTAGAMVVGDPHAPAVGGRRAGDGDVAAEADEHAAARPPRWARSRGAVGGQRLGGRAEVEADAASEPDRPGARGRPDRPPAGDRANATPSAPRRRPRRGRAPPRRSRGRSRARSAPAPTVGSTSPSVSRAARSASSTASSSSGLTATVDAGGCVQRRQLGVVAEAAARQVERGRRCARRPRAPPASSPGR